MYWDGYYEGATSVLKYLESKGLIEKGLVEKDNELYEIIYGAE